MTPLLRAPEPSGSWSWDFDTDDTATLRPALAAAARVAGVLEEYDLLRPETLEYRWFVRGFGGVGVATSLALRTPLDAPDLPDRIDATRPAGFPDAEFGMLVATGPGSWTDASGRRHAAHGLATLGVIADPYAYSVEVSVYHDVWTAFAFSGEPHPEVRARNAPVLEAVLRRIDSAVGVPAEPGPATYFGSPEGYAIAAPDTDERGWGPDLTDKIV